MSKRPAFPGMGGMNMQQMMKQAKKLQEQMAQEQENITTQEFTGKAADDMVVATFTGDRTLKSLFIKPEAIIDAVNKGLKQIDQVTQQSLGKYTKGLM